MDDKTIRAEEDSSDCSLEYDWTTTTSGHKISSELWEVIMRIMRKSKMRGFPDWVSYWGMWSTATGESCS